MSCKHVCRAKQECKQVLVVRVISANACGNMYAFGTAQSVCNESEMRARALELERMHISFSVCVCYVGAVRSNILILSTLHAVWRAFDVQRADVFESDLALNKHTHTRTSHIRIRERNIQMWMKQKRLERKRRQYNANETRRLVRWTSGRLLFSERSLLARFVQSG